MMSRPFAWGTSVTIATSKMELEKLLAKHGATSFACASELGAGSILFAMRGRRVRFDLALQTSTAAPAEAENRRRWRCLVALVKAKLVSVADGLSTFEEEFLAQIVIPGKGETVGQWIGPQIAAAYGRGEAMPPLLGSGR
jgi:hypothetical protein